MWRKRQRKQKTDPARPEPDGFGSVIADECEAWLAGGLASYQQSIGRPVTAVGWLNHVVHATTAELGLLAAGEVEAIQPLQWRRAVAYLSRSLLERAAETGRPPADLQRELLVPLEIELIGDPEAADMDSADLIRAALARLYEIPELPA